MFLFVKVEEEKSEGIACLPAQSCAFECRWVGFPFPPLKLLFVNTGIYIHKFPSSRKKKVSLELTAPGWTTEPTAALHTEVCKTIHLDKSHGCSGNEFLRWLAAHSQHVLIEGWRVKYRVPVYPQCRLARPVKHKAKWKIVASRWLLCYK